MSQKWPIAKILVADFRYYFVHYLVLFSSAKHPSPGTSLLALRTLVMPLAHCMSADLHKPPVKQQRTNSLFGFTWKWPLKQWLTVFGLKPNYWWFTGFRLKCNTSINLSFGLKADFWVQITVRFIVAFSVEADAPVELLGYAIMYM